MPCMLRILGVIVALCIALVREVRGLLGSCWLTPRGAAARGAALPDAALDLVHDLRPPGALIPARCSASPRLPVLPRPATAPGAPDPDDAACPLKNCPEKYPGTPANVGNDPEVFPDQTAAVWAFVVEDDVKVPANIAAGEWVVGFRSAAYHS